MFYDCWRSISQAKARRNQVALADLSSGLTWSFGQLARAVEAAPPVEAPVTFPSGSSSTFIVDVLRAWRWRKVVCPLEPGQAVPHLPRSLPPELVHLKTTSATTGTPRLVAFTAAQLQADARNILRTMGLREEWPNVALISLAHSYGFSNLVLPLLLHGIPLVLAGAVLPESVRRAAAAFEAITIPAVPALWQAWCEAGSIPANLRLAISAGAPLPLVLEQTVFSRYGVKIHNFYGSSECGGIGYDGTENPRIDPACVGAAMSDVEVRVGHEGCIEVRGAAVGQTYWPEPDSALGNGVFKTSDVGEISGSLIYLRGRATDQINVAGRKVLPEAIERVLLSHPGVRACVTFGVPGVDARRGDTIVACVAAHPSMTGKALKEFALLHLPPWQVPRKWWLLGSLRTNGRGKISRAEWRKRYLSAKPHG